MCRGFVPLISWMGLFVNPHQLFKIDIGVALRCAERGMAQKFLYLPQIGAVLEQMCREAVPQGMRRCGVRQAELFAQSTHCLLRHALVELTASGS